jgi:hypothetical protein
VSSPFEEVIQNNVVGEESYGQALIDELKQACWQSRLGYNKALRRVKDISTSIDSNRNLSSTDT